MKKAWGILAGLSISACVCAIEPDDFARQWPVLGSCAVSTTLPASTSKPLDCEGAFAVSLDESVYRQLLRPDLADLAAFNADGQTLPFGPMPSIYRPPPGEWTVAPWFALPATDPQQAQDLHLHVTRSTTGDLNLDATLSHGPRDSLQDILVDVRGGKRLVEAIQIELVMDAPDFSVEVGLDASDDLQSWRPVVGAAAIAQLRQGGQALIRRHIEFPPQSTAYLRLHVLSGTSGIPVRAVRLLLRPRVPASETLKRSKLSADFVRREGRAYVYTLPARVPVERVNVLLGDDNAIASFSVSAREPREKNWSYVGQMNAFRLRGAGVAMDNEAMDVAISRQQEWRIESSIDLQRTPVLELGYRPERWLLLTHGKPPFVVTAGSPVVHRDQFPLDALLGQVRAHYGKDWQPPVATLGAMQTAGGEAALSAYDPESRRTWLLWSILSIGAIVIIVMVLRLLRVPPDS